LIVSRALPEERSAFDATRAAARGTALAADKKQAQPADRMEEPMFGTEYVCVTKFTSRLPDIEAWEAKMLALGVDREAFSIIISAGGSVLLKFWEPDRIEAIRILAALDEMEAIAA